MTEETKVVKRRRVTGGDNDQETPLAGILAMPGVGELVQRFLTFVEMARNRRVSRTLQRRAAPESVFGTVETKARVLEHVAIHSVQAVQESRRVQDVDQSLGKLLAAFTESVEMDNVTSVKWIVGRASALGLESGRRDLVVRLLRHKPLYALGRRSLLRSLSDVTLTGNATFAILQGIVNNMDDTKSDAQSVSALAGLIRSVPGQTIHGTLRLHLLAVAAVAASSSGARERAEAVIEALRNDVIDGDHNTRGYLEINWNVKEVAEAWVAAGLGTDREPFDALYEIDRYWKYDLLRHVIRADGRLDAVRVYKDATLSGLIDHKDTYNDFANAEPMVAALWAAGYETDLSTLRMNAHGAWGYYDLRPRAMRLILTRAWSDQDIKHMSPVMVVLAAETSKAFDLPVLDALVAATDAKENVSKPILRAFIAGLRVEFNPIYYYGIGAADRVKEKAFRSGLADVLETKYLVQ